jgi:dTDP-glucose 4,6-dehydratase
VTRILVTGGRGFIGTNLVSELRSRGHETWVADLQNCDDPQFFRCDVRQFRQVERLFERGDYDILYHLAAEYGRWNGEDYYENLWNTNAVGTKNMIRMQEKKHFRLVFFSSAEVYGDYDGRMSEDVMDETPIKQMNDYAMTKWVGEMQVLNSASMFGTETVRIRPFNVYGPGEHYTLYRGFIPKFIYSGMKDLPYTVYLGHKRTLEYVKDVCSALSNLTERFRPGEVYNLGGEKTYDIKQVSDMILKSLGKTDSNVTYKKEEGFTTKVKTPDSSKAKRDLGFSATIPVEEGIAKTVEWFRNTYGGSREI